MKFGLFLKANLENITNLCSDRNEFRWYIKMKCCSCNEVNNEYIYFTEHDSVYMKANRGRANLSYKCKFCKKDSSIVIVKSSIVPYNIEDSEKSKMIVAFECRGSEPVEFDPRRCWTARSTRSSASFADVNLTEKDWSEYDDDAGCTVGIYDVSCHFEVLRGH